MLSHRSEALNSIPHCISWKWPNLWGFLGTQLDFSILIVQVENFCNNCFSNFPQIQKCPVLLVYYTTHSDFIHTSVFSWIASVIAIKSKTWGRCTHILLSCYVPQSFSVRVIAAEIEWTGICYLLWLSSAKNFLSSSIPFFGYWKSVSSTTSGCFCKGGGPGRHTSQKQCLTDSQAFAQLCFLDV